MHIQQLLFRDPLLPGESLRSWVARLCLSNLLFPRQILRGVRYAAENDIDLIPSTSLIDRVCTISNTEESIVLASTAQRYVGWGIERIGSCYERTPLWHAYYRNSEDAYVYCPVCLRNDEIPYFRIAWRFAIYIFCPRHGCEMLDRCPHCQAPVDPLYQRFGLAGSKATWHPLNRCGVCGSLYEAAPEISASRTEDFVLMTVLDALEDDYFSFQGQEHVYAFQFTHVLRWLAGLLPSRRLQHLLGFVLIASSLQAIKMDTPKLFEVRPLLERKLLLRAALWLLEDWPSRFLSTCNDLRIGITHFFTGNPAPCPYWFESVFRRNLNRRSITRSSKASVLALEKAMREKYPELRPRRQPRPTKPRKPLALPKLSVEEAFDFFERADQLVDQPSWQRASSRRQLIRNLALLAIMAITKLSLIQLLQISAAELVNLLGEWTARCSHCKATFVTHTIRHYVGPDVKRFSRKTLAFHNKDGKSIDMRCIAPGMRRQYRRISPSLQSITQLQGVLQHCAIDGLTHECG